MKIFVRVLAVMFLATALFLPLAVFADEPENLDVDANQAENAPPVIPHPIADNATGKDCLVCHSTGLNGAPPTPHPTRVNCTQCHVRSDLSDPKKVKKSKKAKKDK
jgi:nitrate reductase cytochrome c-type subunit